MLGNDAYPVVWACLFIGCHSSWRGSGGYERVWSCADEPSAVFPAFPVRELSGWTGGAISNWVSRRCHTTPGEVLKSSSFKLGSQVTGLPLLQMSACHRVPIGLLRWFVARRSTFPIQLLYGAKPLFTVC